MSDSEKIVRYGIDTAGGDLFLDAQGDVVLYADHNARITALESRVAALVEAVDFYLAHTRAHEHCPGRKDPERCNAHIRMSKAKAALERKGG